MVASVQGSKKLLFWLNETSLSLCACSCSANCFEYHNGKLWLSLLQLETVHEIRKGNRVPSKTSRVARNTISQTQHCIRLQLINTFSDPYAGQGWLCNIPLGKYVFLLIAGTNGIHPVIAIQGWKLVSACFLLLADPIHLHWVIDCSPLNLFFNLTCLIGYHKKGRA